MNDLFNDFFANQNPEYIKIWQNSVVGIAGVGGLGSNIAISLTRAGIGKLILADPDTVSNSNLSRQQYFLNQVGLPKVAALKDNLMNISPFTLVNPYPLKITPVNLSMIFGKIDILIEALDDADQKQMLIENWQELYPEKYIIGASGIAGVGKNELIHTEQIGTLFLIGDGISEIEDGVYPTAARVAVVANMQANLCLELLLQKGN
ncbi:MAG: sulfur carrier protein ThiS adenylyltransferase ThiF [Candidatus Cloacimonadaceae bacterium]|jgi:sulfur carrier protein ThiS adenylyltransferase|nr:sulfur carrier protein ThiS adenylyltransferase ThiF [Candidatus Cloacimonadota bacterium]MDD5624993.1 sulfur carrier protein ThiS adenylyltransferase ThiF [Candidatus Cloacimonadota bacterium]MDY0112079.1 sulfur carrier protein ThiS adenylyltransferase ThiF [Candidatus Syntrophosphaera sp.]